MQQGLGCGKDWDTADWQAAGFGMERGLGHGRIWDAESPRPPNTWNLGCRALSPFSLCPTLSQLRSRIPRGPGAVSMLRPGAQADPAYFSWLLINRRSSDRINIPSKHLSSPTPLPSPSLGKMIYSRKCSCLEKRLRGKGRGFVGGICKAHLCWLLSLPFHVDPIHTDGFGAGR